MELPKSSVSSECYRNYVNCRDYDKQVSVRIRKVYRKFDEIGTIFDIFNDDTNQFYGTVKTVAVDSLYGGTYVFEAADGQTFGPCNGTAQAPSGSTNVTLAGMTHLLRAGILG